MHQTYVHMHQTDCIHIVQKEGCVSTRAAVGMHEISEYFTFLCLGDSHGLGQTLNILRHLPDLILEQKVERI